MPKVISANRLADGIVVYAGHGGAWFERLNAARIFTSKKEADAGLSLAEDDVSRNFIVEPCIVDVTQDPGGLRPSTLRESIRAQGPTIDLAFGPTARYCGQQSPMTCGPLDARRVKLNLPLLLQRGSRK
jgi:hypothetical protein